jgi:hypothetical protein
MPWLGLCKDMVSRPPDKPQQRCIFWVGDYSCNKISQGDRRNGWVCIVSRLASPPFYLKKKEKWKITNKRSVIPSQWRKLSSTGVLFSRCGVDTEHTSHFFSSFFISSFFYYNIITVIWFCKPLQPPIFEKKKKTQIQTHRYSQIETITTFAKLPYKIIILLLRRSERHWIERTKINYMHFIVVWMTCRHRNNIKIYSFNVNILTKTNQDLPHNYII